MARQSRTRASPVAHPAARRITPARCSACSPDGGRMCVAASGDAVVGVAVYRVYENTSDGLHLYVDDLVTDESRRSNGVGQALMNHLQQVARDAGCENYKLDSGVQRQRAHKFYFREGMVVTAFHFGKRLK